MKRLSTLLTCLLLAFGVNAQKGFDENASTSQPVANKYEKVSIAIGQPGESAQVLEALLIHFPELSAQGYSFQLQNQKNSPFAHHYDFRQTFNGLQLYMRGTKANVSKKGRLFSLLNHLYQEVPQQVANFSQTAGAAATKAKGLWSDTNPQYWVQEKVYFVKENQLIPAYRIEMDAELSVWEILIDATNLEILLQRDLGVYHHSATGGGDTTGTAMVFNPDPLSTSGNPYNANTNWSDNNDADNADLNGQRQSVTLKGLMFDGVVFRLDGPHVTVQELEVPTTQIATSTTGNFNFTRSQSGFEDVMVYYHIDTFQRYIQTLGFDSLCNRPLRVDAHGLNGQDNSHFVPQGNNPRLGFGEGCVDDAEDADVIIHEYGHALSYDAAPGTNAGNERNGQDEGLGDYVAASYSKALTYTYWKNTFTWDGHNTCWDGRSASDPTPYPPSSSNFYVYGAIWASTLMEVYDQIGKEQSDAVVFQALYAQSFNTTLTDAAHSILDADSLIYNGSHTAQYVTAFCDRGIFTGAECLVSRADPTVERPEWILAPNPSNGQTSIVLTSVKPGMDLEYQLVNPLGQVLQQAKVLPQVTPVNLEGLPAGVYLVVMKSGNQAMGSQRLIRMNQ